MPSCVVQWCRNNSTAHKKSDGITFHNFPKDPNRRKKWIEIIRRSRNCNNWSPSNFSLVCSSHFDDRDLYMTENGLRRVTRSAIPKRTLCELSSNMLRLEFVKPEASITPQNVSCDVRNVKHGKDARPSTSDHPPGTSTDSHLVLREVKIEYCDDTSNHSQPYDVDREHLTIIKSENGLTFDVPEKEVSEKHLTIQQMKVNPHNNNIKLQKVAFNEPNVKFVNDARKGTSTDSQLVLGNVIKVECSDDTYNHSPMCDAPSKEQSTIMEFPVSPICEDSEDRLICDSPDKELLKKQLNIQKIKLNANKTKIKTLNQKIRRLINKNKSLKVKLQYFENIHQKKRKINK